MDIINKINITFTDDNIKKDTKEQIYNMDMLLSKKFEDNDNLLQYVIGHYHRFNKMIIMNILNKVKECNEIDYTNDVGWTALMLASLHSSHDLGLYVLKELIKAGAKLNIRSGELGCTALMMAAAHTSNLSSLDTVRELIKAGADISIKNSNGYTAVMFAAQNSLTTGSLDTVIELRNAGADINDKEIKTVLSYFNMKKYDVTEINKIISSRPPSKKRKSMQLSSKSPY